MVVKERSIEQTFRENSRLPVDAVVVRGIIKKDTIKLAESQNRDYYYIDTGYVGNFPSPGNESGKKIWHRIVKNGLQHSEIKAVPDDRWQRLVEQDPRLQWRGWKNYDKKILLVLPNPKATRFYDIDYDQWVSTTISLIKTYTDLPVETRVKGTRSERGHGYSIYDAFDSGVYATVAFNSIAALESVLYGIPAFVSVPCAASPLAATDLSKLSQPFRPEPDIIVNQCRNIAYGQFNMAEIESGQAFEIIQRYHR
jgi:hypothetical protein